MIQERILDSNREGKNLLLIMHGCLGQSSAVLTNYEYGYVNTEAVATDTLAFVDMKQSSRRAC